jgi:hypothetical protein
MFGVLADAVLVFYLSLIIWRVYSQGERLWKQSSSLLDTICHVILVLFLYLTFHLLKEEHLNLRISLSTALSALCACLVSLVFGISLGRSWGYAEAKGERELQSVNGSEQERKRVLKQKQIPISGESNAFVAHQHQQLPPSLSSTPAPPPETTIDTQEIYEAAEVAKLNLLSILEINQPNRSETLPRNWKLVRSGNSSHVWMAAHKASNTLIKGSCVTSLSSAAIAKYFYENNLPTGLESIMREKETLFTFRRNRVVVTRLLCNLGTLTSAKREFYLVTYWAEMENGTIVICSRSLPESYTPQISTTANQHSKHKSYTRGFISSCGFVIVPNHVRGEEKRGCQVLYSVDIDFFSTSMGMKRQHSAKAEAIINATLERLDHLSSIPPEEANANTIDSLTLSPGTLLDHAMGSMNTTSQKHYQSVIQGVSYQHHLELKSISKDAINRLLSLHMSATAKFTTSNPHKLPSGRDAGDDQASERKWTTFFDQDGIAISEYCGHDSPVGTLMASCHVNVSPASFKAIYSLIVSHHPLLSCTLSVGLPSNDTEAARRVP